MTGKVIALGFFDGVHLGHQAILREAERIASERNMESGAITFENHPRSFVLGITPQMITTPDERRDLLRAHGARHVYILRFDAQTADTPPIDFALRLKQEYDAAVVVCGHSFRFGRSAEGTAELFEQIGIEAARCEGVRARDGRVISSTAIRQMVREGDVEGAAAFLGRPFSLAGEVVRGYRVGRHLGFPTMNVQIARDIVLPRRGVYDSRVEIDGARYRALTNIGSRPTFSSADIVSVESHILDFSGELYGKRARVELTRFLRPERAFESARELQAQIEADLKSVTNQ